MRCISVIILVIIVPLVSAQTVSKLYAVESVWHVPSNLTNVPGKLVEIDLNQNTTITLVTWEFPQSISYYIVGSAFDPVNRIYYFVYNVGIPQVSYLAAINVDQREVLYSNVEISLGKLIEWDIDIDTENNIRFLARTSAPKSNRVLVDYCVWNPVTKETKVLMEGIASVTILGNLVYNRFSDSILVTTSGLVAGDGSPDMLFSLAANYWTSSIPASELVRTQGNIQWNNIANVGYLVQMPADVNPAVPYQIVKYEPNTNQFPLVCPIETDAVQYRIRYSFTESSSLDDDNNAFAILVTRSVANNEPDWFSAIIVVFLDSCQSRIVTLPKGREIAYGGLEFDQQ